VTVAAVWKFYAKEIFKRWEFWTLAVLLMTFWQSTGAYVFADYSFPPEVRQRVGEEMWRKLVHSYTGGWYGVAALFTLAFVAVELVHVTCHSVISLRFLSKYSKASAPKFFAGLVLASLTAAIAATCLLVASTVVFYSHKFYNLEELILPQNPLGILAVTLAGGLFVYFLSMTLALLVVLLRRPRALTAVSFVPAVLAFMLGYTANYAGGTEMQIQPFSLIVKLGDYYYSGVPLDLTRPNVQVWMAWLRGEPIDAMEPLLVWLMVACWIVLFALLSLLLLRKQRGVNVEEFMA